GVDRTIAAMGLTVLRTPVRAPQANTFCERLIGTIRRECLDFVIPDERHVRSVVAEWVAHYNRGRPHARSGARHPRSIARLSRIICRWPSGPRRPLCRRQTDPWRPALRVSS